RKTWKGHSVAHGRVLTTLEVFTMNVNMPERADLSMLMEIITAKAELLEPNSLF
ncbi:hypothetical protein CEXT_439091, partial [Caerostris extrusa]